jgi:protein SYS1
VLTTYYSASLPTSLFFWIVLLASCAGTIIVAEQLCVKREMSEGLVVVAPPPPSQSSGSGMGGDGEDIEMGRLMGDRRD